MQTAGPDKDKRHGTGTLIAPVTRTRTGGASEFLVEFCVAIEQICLGRHGKRKNRFSPTEKERQVITTTTRERRGGAGMGLIAGSITIFAIHRVDKRLPPARAPLQPPVSTSLPQTTPAPHSTVFKSAPPHLKLIRCTTRLFER